MLSFWTAVAIALSGCRVDDPSESVPSFRNSDLLEIESVYAPPAQAVIPLLEQFEEAKRSYAQGVRDGEDKPLSEAVWLAEADLNFLRGDAAIVSDTTNRDSLFYDLPIQLDGSGQPRVTMEELILMQEQLVSGIAHENEAGAVYMVDLSIVSLTAIEVRIRILVVRRYIPPGGPRPPPTGCYVLHHLNGGEDAVSVMNTYLTYMENDAWLLDWHPSFFTSVSPWVIITDNTLYQTVGPYPMYVGTEEALGGPYWLANGASNEQVCFPNYWNKYLVMKNWYFSQFPDDGSEHVLVDQEYDWGYGYVSGVPMDYGSPYYPMGSYYHFFKFKRGIRVRI